VNFHGHEQIMKITENQKGKAVFNSTVKAILLYSSKFWTITHKMIQRLQVLSMKSWPNSAPVSNIILTVWWPY